MEDKEMARYPVGIHKPEPTHSPQGRQETIRILFVILGVGLLSLWTYWQALFFYLLPFQRQNASRVSDIMAGAVFPLWLACFFPALGLGLGLYTFTRRLPRNEPLFAVRPKKIRLTMIDTLTYVMLCTAICLFLVNYRILPIFPLCGYGTDRIGELFMAFPEGAPNLWGGMTVLEQLALNGALGVLVVFLQAWWVMQKRGGRLRNLGLLAASLLVVGLLIPWSGCLGLMPMSSFDTVAERKEIQLSPEILEQYVGTYELRPGVDFAITLEEGQLYTQITGQQKFPLFPEAENRFFLKIAESEHVYIKDEKGAVTGCFVGGWFCPVKKP